MEPSESKLLDAIRREIDKRRSSGMSWAEIANEMSCPVHRCRTFMSDAVKYPRVHDCEQAYTVLTGRKLNV